MRRMENCKGGEKEKQAEHVVQAVLAVGSIGLYLALSCWAKPAGPVSADGTILRDGYGGDEKQVQILVEGLETDKTEVPVTVTVGPRRYSSQEADAVFEELMEQMEERIRGNNRSLMEVCTDLELPKRIEDRGVRLKWYSSDPDRLSASGKLLVSVEKPEPLLLHVQLTDGEHKADYEIPVRLVPAEQSLEEQMREKFRQEIQKQEKSQQESERFVLPGQYAGKELRYRTQKDNRYALIPILGILMAVLWPARKQSELRKQEKKREQELLLDYAELVSKLMIFIGAGMNVRNAWARITADYEHALGQGKSSRRAAYEEMQLTWYQIQNGMSEGSAYREFGRRCRLQPYLKLGGLLEQNCRSGTKDLRSIMETELSDAFELRKNLARRMGEEAGTKLLLPLFMMLGVVMVMIMVPAMMTMG